MKIVNFTLAAAAAVLLASQANATIINNQTWTLGNQTNVLGLGQTNVTHYDFENGGANVVATYKDNELFVAGQALQVSTGNLVNIFLQYDDVTVNGNNLTATDLDRVGFIGADQVFATGGGGSLRLVADATNATATFDGWFNYTNGQKYGDIHSIGTLNSPVASAVSEPAMGLAFLGTLGLLAFGTRRLRKNA